LNNFLLIIREYFVKAQYTGNEQLFGKTAIVTGANTGIGKEVVHDLARRGMDNNNSDNNIIKVFLQVLV
jgi:hypothetical protein